jgi:hypothetical protein
MNNVVTILSLEESNVEPMFKVGSAFVVVEHNQYIRAIEREADPIMYGSLYVLSQVDNGEFALISTDSGNRYSNPMTLAFIRGNPNQYIPASELSKLFMSSEYIIEVKVDISITQKAKPISERN